MWKRAKELKKIDEPKKCNTKCQPKCPKCPVSPLSPTPVPLPTAAAFSLRDLEEILWAQEKNSNNPGDTLLAVKSSLTQLLSIDPNRLASSISSITLGDKSTPLKWITRCVARMGLSHWMSLHYQTFLFQVSVIPDWFRMRIAPAILSTRPRIEPYFRVLWDVVEQAVIAYKAYKAALLLEEPSETPVEPTPEAIPEPEPGPESTYELDQSKPSLNLDVCGIIFRKFDIPTLVALQCVSSRFYSFIKKSILPFKEKKCRLCCAIFKPRKMLPCPGHLSPSWTRLLMSCCQWEPSPKTCYSGVR